MVAIVDADPHWPNEFEKIAAEVRAALEDEDVRIDHIGSTSVAGLPAKDVIDVQIAVRDEDSIERVADALAARGWRRGAGSWSDHPVPGLPTEEAGWTKGFLNEPTGHRPTNVHVRVSGRANARYALLFRDFLRAHPNEAAAYAELKRRLAAIAPDGVTYADTKDPACDLVYFAAEHWAEETGWVSGH